MRIHLTLWAAIVVGFGVALPSALADEPAVVQQTPPEPKSGLKLLSGVDLVAQGDIAPDFTLKSPTGQDEVTLSQFRGQRPVALVFGSFT